jgi:hypothetical protein
MILSRLAVPALLIAFGTSAIAAVQPTIAASPAVTAEPLEPSVLGASLRPRWPGSNDEVAYLGTARLEWAFRLRLPPGATLRNATISGYAPLHLALSDGSCIAAAPRNLTRGKVALDTVEEPCSASAPGARGNSAARSGLFATTASHHYSLWRTADGSTVVRYGLRGEQVSRLPIAPIAAGGLPVLHAGGEAVTLMGRMGADLVIVSLTAPPRP